MSETIEALAGFATQYGYPGIFIVSVAGSAIPFLPLPYLALVVLLSTTQDPLWLGIIAGMGGALGKVTSYLLGRGGYALVGKETRRSLDSFHDFISKYGMFGVFLFAVTPLPDDVYIIPTGIVRLPFWRFFIANLAGKIVLSVTVAYLGRESLPVVSFFLGGESLIAAIVMMLATVVLSIVLLKADWMLAVETARTKGLFALATDLPAILRLKRRRRSSRPK